SSPRPRGVRSTSGLRRWIRFAHCRGRLSGKAGTGWGPDRLVVQPGVLEELIPVGCVVDAADPEGQCASRLPGLGVAADVVAEEVVGEQQVACVPGDLLGR